MKKYIYILLFLFSFQVNATTNWMKSLEQAQKLSQLLNKPILVDFWATWCGPCRAMESDVWNKEEIQELIKYNYIPVKIDIDSYESLARKYNVRKIPTILILDSWGNPLYKSSGYKRKNNIKKLLTSFSINLYRINGAMKIWQKSKKKFSPNLRVGLRYQEVIPFLKGKAKRSFFKESNHYLKQAHKFLKNDAIKEEKIELLKLLNKAYYGKTESVLEELKELKNINSQNLSLYHFMKYYCYDEIGQKEEANKALENLKNSEENDSYLKKIQTLSKLKQK